MSMYRLLPAPPVEARQWNEGTDPEDLAAWCDGWTYIGDRHGHTTPPFIEHTCINTEAVQITGKGHADPGDWIVRVGEHAGYGLYEILPPDEFAQRYERVSG